MTRGTVSPYGWVWWRARWHLQMGSGRTRCGRTPPPTAQRTDDPLTDGGDLCDYCWHWEFVPKGGW
jgi:hypothetical protein